MGHGLSKEEELWVTRSAMSPLTWHLPVWLVGPSVGYDSPEERPAPVLKIWPVRVPIRELRPDEFNPLISELKSSHCK